MKKSAVIIISISLFSVCEVTSFDQFVSYFPSKGVPFSLDNYNTSDGKAIPSKLAFEYICKGDSSMLTFINTGQNQETQKIIYSESSPYEYKAYAKFKVDKYYFLIYDGYVDDGLHEFTKVINVGLFSNNGVFLDEMPFYVFDDSGKLNEHKGQITPSHEIIIEIRDYERNERGAFLNSYKEKSEVFEIDEQTGQFVKIKESLGTQTN
ncbi:MAG: hypothetical protein KI791_14360 [Cyclobacteriaceae bacterium]|nr:hypothetical protein [Cyclobacteriaceae bacterium SS2]